MKVKKLSGKVQDAQQIPTLFDNENITYHPIDIVNWKEYPYQPQVSFRIAYTNDAILVHYKVVEDIKPFPIMKSRAYAVMAE